jgi:hypothetical protein
MLLDKDYFDSFVRINYKVGWLGDDIACVKIKSLNLDHKA